MSSVVRIRRAGGELVQDCDIYIGRSCNRGGWNLPHSEWANPFTVKKCGSAQEACYRYEEWMKQRIDGEPQLRDRLSTIDGKVLGCWCEPGAPCHGQVLLDLINEFRMNIECKGCEEIKCESDMEPCGYCTDCAQSGGLQCWGDRCQ